MSEEKAKTGDNNSLYQKEINILVSSKRKNNKSINGNDIILSYGRYKIFYYDKNGEPLFLIGPDYCYFISITILNFIFFIFINCVLFMAVNFWIIFFGMILNVLQLLCLVICGIKNPGLPRKDMQNEDLLEKFPDKFERCHLCNLIIDNTKNFRHCDICQCCCEEMDHHCPWTSKCVGKGNIFYFNGMLIMIFIIFFYMIGTLLFINK